MAAHRALGAQRRIVRANVVAQIDYIGACWHSLVHGIYPSGVENPLEHSQRSMHCYRAPARANTQLVSALRLGAWRLAHCPKIRLKRGAELGGPPTLTAHLDRYAHLGLGVLDLLGD